jgi:signal transduction histidine kinase
MLDRSVNEVTARIATTYLAEGLIASVIVIAFLYFAHIYKRSYLKTWALSFGSFAVSVFAVGLTTLYNAQLTEGFKLISSFVAQAGIFLHAFFLLIGLFELFRGGAYQLKFLIGWAAVVVGLSFLTIWVFYDAEGVQGSLNRYLLRIGTRYFVIAFSFLCAAVLAWRSPLFKKGIGQRLLIVAFLLYGVTYSYYFSIVTFNYFGGIFSFPFFFGMIELLLITLSGLGMVLWLLEDERDRLSKINSELDSFLYSTSHDLRSPIASILGITNVAKLELTDETALRYMTMIEERIKKLDLVISDILKLSRSKKLDIKLESIRFDDLLKDTIADVKFNQNAPEISLRYTETPDDSFLSDYIQMKIVLSNLIANAVKYHNIKQDDPFIRVAFQRTGKNVRIEVEDSGRGIPKEALPKIFDMFYRAETSVEGTGLGLYIVKEALAKINGKIEVKSEYGAGSTFTITLLDA